MCYKNPIYLHCILLTIFLVSFTLVYIMSALVCGLVKFDHINKPFDMFSETHQLKENYCNSENYSNSKTKQHGR